MGKITSNKNAILSSNRWRHVLGPLLGLVIFSVAIYTLHNSLKHLTWSDVVAPMQRISWYEFVLAALFTALSYLTLTNYDRLAMVYIGRSLPLKKIMAVSFTAYAVGHNVGLVALSGGSIRYHAYSSHGFSGIEIATLIGFCTITFVLGASLLLGIALLLESANALQQFTIPTYLLHGAGLMLLGLPLVYLSWVAVSESTLFMGNWSLKSPGLSLALQQIVTAAIDLVFAASVIYILLPSETISFAAYLSAYVIATGVAIVSSVPGGIGIFEGLMLVQLPQIREADLLGAMLLFRLIYYAAPLLVALVMLSAGEVAARHHARETSRRT
jgi:phosphatidylglycerol lysyltransferase